jgi:hypothetical protein
MNNHAQEQYNAQHPAANAVELKQYTAQELPPAEWTTTDIAVTVIFAVLAAWAVWRAFDLIRKKIK